MPMTSSKRKKPFVLLEVVIAMALVSIGILPFLHYPHQQMAKEIDLLFVMELERVATNELAKLRTETILRSNFDQSLIFAEEENRSPIEVDEKYTVTLAGMKKTYIKKNYIYWESQKEKDQSVAVLFTCETKFYAPKQKDPVLSAKLAFATVAQKKT